MLLEESISIAVVIPLAIVGFIRSKDTLRCVLFTFIALILCLTPIATYPMVCRIIESVRDLTPEP